MKIENQNLKLLVQRFAEKKIILDAIQANEQWEGIVGSGLSFVFSGLYIIKAQPIFVLVSEKEDARKLTDEFEFLLGKESVVYFPSTELKPYQIEETATANMVLRTRALTRLYKDPNKVIVSSVEGLYEKVPLQKEVNKKSIPLEIGKEVGLQKLNEKLYELGFIRVDFVSQPGEFSIRGGIIDVFSFNEEDPYRLVFFDDEIDKIKKFSINDQLSKSDHKKIIVFGDSLSSKLEGKRESILSILPKESIVFESNRDLIFRLLKSNFENAEEKYREESKDKLFKNALPVDLYLSKDNYLEEINRHKPIFHSTSERTGGRKALHQIPQPPYNKNFSLVVEALQDYQDKGFDNYIVCSDEKQSERINEVLKNEDAKLFKTLLGNIHNGFIDKELKILVFTDHQIFERFHKTKPRTAFAKKDQLDFKALVDLQMGDFVTHIDYGIGRFAGLKKIEVNGKIQESIKLIYQNNDILYVNVHSLHKISKYSGVNGRQPKTSKLGSPAWNKLKKKTRSKVKELAFDLIKLYAKRKSQKGFSFDPDSYLQKELEASFIYEDTPDQSLATTMLKKDMEQDKPMDRLICGDVGFGKTEVAIRAAFKAVDNNKQVVVLVPTTILAFQHYHSFSKRLKDFPVRIDYLNRFRTTKEKAEILLDLKVGKVDILIGTHQVISKNVVYKDLGLLIVDEEHKFGVSVKEKLRTIRENIDTLTLTATPIPRTLQFSLMAARDLSVIKTPPPNRQPIDTMLTEFNEEVIRDAIINEMDRGGQVFFLHNRVENIMEMAGLLNRLVPGAKVAIGHGQMEGKKLEKVFLDFIAGKQDILVSTTIIESGLDVPNANTIFINNAHRFGLADIHQIRGRVGRSNKKAYCYLVAPPLDRLNKEASTRLNAIIQFSDLGSGFDISMKDLEIRGAGDLLGAEQSGFICELGFDAYQNILIEAVDELKHEEFADLFEEELSKQKFVSDVQLDIDQELLIPDTYVNKVEERMALYNKLNKVEDEIQLNEYKRILVDRFGEMPDELKGLLASVKLKWLAKDIGFEKIVLKNNICLAYFVRDTNSKYYKSDKFSSVLNYVQSTSGKIQIKEKLAKDGKPYLLLRVDKMSQVQEVIDLLDGINKKVLF